MEILDTKLFRGISEDDYGHLKSHLDLYITEYRKGQTVCNYGEDSDRMGIVLTGRAAVFRTDYNGNEYMLENLGQGSFFSEAMSYSKTSGDRIFVRCAMKSRIAFINYNVIRYSVENESAEFGKIRGVLQNNLLGLLIERAGKLSEHIGVLACSSIREKLLCFFRLQLGNKDVGKFELPFTWRELAAYINADRSAMMREINKMNKDGIISTKLRTVRVHERV